MAAGGCAGSCGGVAERHQRESYLALGIDVEQAIHGVVYESADYFGGQASAVPTASRLASRVPLSQPKWR